MSPTRASNRVDRGLDSSIATMDIGQHVGSFDTSKIDTRGGRVESTDRYSSHSHVDSSLATVDE